MFETKPLHPRFGADIIGVDLAAMDDATFQQLHTVWLHAGVLRIREQQLNDDQLQAFSQRFGPLEQIPLGRMPEAQRKKFKNLYVTVISNIIVDGQPIGGLGSGEATWHSDMTYVDTPPPASVLLGVEIPVKGGDTWFADQATAYEAIPHSLRQRIARLQIKHDAAHTSVGQLRHGFEPFDDPRDAPGAIHPIVRIHSETGRPCLYLGRREWAYVEGLTLEDSEALLDQLWRYAVLSENVWCQQWQVGDVIVWDNRRVLHRRDEIEPTNRRLMRRCQVLSPNQ